MLQNSLLLQVYLIVQSMKYLLNSIMYCYWRYHVLSVFEYYCMKISHIIILNETVYAKTYPLLILFWDKNALHLNSNNFQKVIAINFLFSALHTTPFFCGKLYFRVLHMHSADDTRLDTPWGSKPPYLRVGAFKSLQIWCGPVAIDLFCSSS